MVLRVTLHRSPGRRYLFALLARRKETLPQAAGFARAAPNAARSKFRTVFAIDNQGSTRPPKREAFLTNHNHVNAVI